ncbi:putative hybrid NRPS/PKS enzyme [Podospora australis]|uniref:Hybrid NRPS/PKS enzyme n=1 Tax=Podospora australis TaxID=1536484 RepID=A0AAN7AQ89_9PEZI|nr:putative hybrid NRPS/PKS enzyme [Podospora australis]
MPTSRLSRPAHPLLGIPTIDPLGLGVTWRNTLDASQLFSLIGQHEYSLPSVLPDAVYAKMVVEALLQLLSGSRVLRNFELDDLLVQNDIELAGKRDKIQITLELQSAGSHERRGDRTDFINFRIRSKGAATTTNTPEKLNALGSIRLRSSTCHRTSPSKTRSIPDIENSPASDRQSETPPPKFIKTLPMSYGQAGFWFMVQLVGDPTFFNGTVSYLITTKHELDVEKLVRLVREMAAQHEGLRTAFFSDPETHQPMQAIMAESPLHLESKKIVSPDALRAETDTMNRSVYDITQGKTLRLLLLAESPYRHHLIIGYHHINIDGMSVIAIAEHLRLAYGGHKLPPPFQQNKFAELQRERLRTGQYASDIAFWKNEFKELPEILPILQISPNTALRSSRPTARTTYRHVQATKRLDSGITARLLEFKKQGYIQSPFSFYLTVFQVLLCRLAQSEDVCIGVATANRQNDAGSSDSIGIFLNLFALRLRSNLSRPFLDLLQENKAKILAGLKHSAVPFDVVLDEVGASRHPSYSPLFQAFINYIPVREDNPFGADGTIQSKEYEIGETIYDIMLAVIDPPAGDPWIAIMAQKELYTQQDAQILLDCFLNLMEAFTYDIHLPGRAPQMFNQLAVQEAIDLGQGVSIDMDFGSLIGQLDEISVRCARQAALRDTHGSFLSYAEMMDKSIQIAHALSGSLGTGIPPGARIGVLQEPTVDWIISMLGIWRVGGSYVPLEVTQGVGRLRSIVRDADLAAVLVHNPTRTLWRKITEGASSTASNTLVVNVANASDITRVPPVSIFYKSLPSDEAIVLYTSGSTGAPKGISLPHRMITNTINGFLHSFPMKPQTVLQQIALSFDVSWWQTLVGLATGGSVLVAGKDARRDPLALTSLIASEGITLTLSVPSEAMSWLQHGADHQLLRQSAWEWHISAGEEIGRNLVRLLRAVDKPDLRFMNAYGPAETIIPHAYEVPYLDHTNALPTTIPIGKVLANYSVYIMDQDNHPLPAGVPGQIVIGGAGVASGYIKRPELTATRFPNDPLASPRAIANGWTHVHLSGDRGYMREDGVFVALGRMNGDTQVKLRGQRFELREVEAALVAAGEGDIGEAVCHVRHRGDDDHEKNPSTAFLVAHVVPAPEMQNKYGTHTSSPAAQKRLQEIVSGLESTLPQYMCPSVVVPVPSLPLSHHGKVDRRYLSTMPLRTEEPKIKTTLPRQNSSTSSVPSFISELEEIWREVLGDLISESQKLDRDSNFFLLGGNSLLLIKVKSKIKERTGREVPLFKLFEHSSLEKMAAAVAPINAPAGEPLNTPAPIPTATIHDTITSTQEKLKRIWISVLGSTVSDPSAIGPESDFFLLGGNSLLLISIQREVNKGFGVLLPLPKLFEATTLARMSTLLDTTMATITPQPSGNSPRRDEEGHINWEDEVTFKKQVPYRSFPPPGPSHDGNTVVLTGSTGFLGRHILKHLLTDPTVSKIHCIAVRDASKFSASVIDSPKITIHLGDLRHPALGLSHEATRQIFSSPNLSIIHNGADVSFLRNYQTLRAANVLSTKTLVKFAIGYSPFPHIHFISTAGVAQLGTTELYEVPLQSFPGQNANGYVASKFVAEKFLENAHAACGLPVTIHRPSYITGGDAPSLDVMHNILFYAEKLQSVPKIPGSVDRWLQFVSIDEVAGDIASDVLSRLPETFLTSGLLKYRNHCGPEEDWVRLDQLGHYLERKGKAERIREVEFEEWIESAGRAGMPVPVGEYLVDLMAERNNDSGGKNREKRKRSWVYPRILKGPRIGGPEWKRAGKL